MAGAVRSAVVLCCAASVAAADPAFEPVPVPEHVYAGGWEHFVGGGLAAFDCNGDALPELYAAGGANPAQLFLNRSDPGGEVHFEPATPDELALTGTTGAYPLDIDSDGILDLLVLGVGGSHAMQGRGNCRFEPFESLGLDLGRGWATAFSATWEAGQTLPTLAIGNYVDRADPQGPFEACDENLLFRPRGDAYGPPLPLAPGHCALSMLFSDWGRHGRSDLRISNDRHYYVRTGEEQMWAMEEIPRLYGEEDGWQVYSIWGMGIAERDLNGDGLPEVYLTSMGDQKLQSLKPGAAGPTYEDAHWNLGIAAQRPYVGDDGRASTGWHVAFGDVQNDGRDDIFVAKGNVEQMPSTAMKDPNNLLVQTEDGTFDEKGDTAGVASMARSRGAAMVDLNADGMLDLAVVNRRAPMEVYRNVTPPEGDWLSIELRQPGINPFAVGAWIDVRTGEFVRSRQRTVGGGHAGGSLVPEHVGLGRTDEAELRVTWPDGTVSDWVSVETNRPLRAVRDGAHLAIESRY